MTTMRSTGGDNPLLPVCEYHQRTKHRWEAYARSPGYLDWDTQPDPFRRFEGCVVLPLVPAAERLGTRYNEMVSEGPVAAAPFDLEHLGLLLELSFGLSAWKQYGSDRWALRCNPSSGNLHPTEAYVVSGDIAHLPAGVYHYRSYEHALEQRCGVRGSWHGLLIGLSSVHWREAWKYGERAYRYCQHDVGHALGALRYAAAALGWRVRLLDEWSDDEIAALLGLDRRQDFADAEPECPDLLCQILPDAGHQRPVPGEWLAATATALWAGRANHLSRRHREDWPVVEEVSAAARKPATAPAGWQAEPLPRLRATGIETPAAVLIKQRRSAQHFDGQTQIPEKTLYRMLDATLPRADMPPFDVWPWPPAVHLLLFIHRVVGLRPGVYLCCRSEGGEALRQRMRPEFEWLRAENAPEHLRLYRLRRADAREAARLLSCHQAIASDGAFSLGMLAHFRDTLEEEGPWAYRRLFWECGLIGQTLYLEAEAAGVRGTGIGCFFDDPVHEVVGLEGDAWQSLYHFTVGAPLEDQRLQTLPAYAHLQAEETAAA